MNTAFAQAISLIAGGDAELLNILGTTARMSLASSLLALLIGVPLGILYGGWRFRGRGALIVVNRALMGLPPVVCGLVFYLLFSGVGPFGPWKMLFTVRLMVLAQVVLIAPLVAGTMEPYVARIAESVRETARGLGLGTGRTVRLLAGSASTRSSSPSCSPLPARSPRWARSAWWAARSPGRRTS